MPEQFEFYSNKLYIDLTKSKSSPSSVVVQLFLFLIHLMNDAIMNVT